MAKAQTKTQGTETNPVINPNQTPKLDNKLSKNPNTKEHKPTKSRQQIYSENYQKNKERKKARRKELYAHQKKQAELTAKQQSAKYYQKVLMSLKQYTELNQQNHKLWLDFNWTLKDCQEAFNKGFGNVVAIMKLREVADNLVRDYWETAKNEVKKGKSWNSLDYDQQQKLTKYWGYEKARIENGYIDTAKQLARQSQTYLKDIELAKFHEERGKVKCDCYSCAEQKKIQGAIKAEIAQESEAEKVQCPECKKMVKKLDEDSGVCKNCTKKYE